MDASLLKHSGSESWTWIRKVRVLEKFRFLTWLIRHDVVPTNVMITRVKKHVAVDSSREFCRCLVENITHYLRDCSRVSRTWICVGLSFTEELSSFDIQEWIYHFARGNQDTTFLAAVWWLWRFRNALVFGNEVWTEMDVMLCIQVSISDIMQVYKETKPR